jgi:hypothetical protein
MANWICTDSIVESSAMVEKLNPEKTVMRAPAAALFSSAYCPSTLNLSSKVQATLEEAPPTAVGVLS